MSTLAKRIITAAVAIPFAILCLFLYDTIFFTIVAATIGGFIIFELFRAVGTITFKAQTILSISCAALFPFFLLDGLFKYIIWLLVVYLLTMSMLFLKTYKELNCLQLFFMIGSTLCTCGFLYTFIGLSRIDQRHGVVYLAIALCLSWFADSGAYFAGTFFGKHKLCKEISPNKTVEGFIGGLLSNGIFIIVFCLIYSKICEAHNEPVETHYLLSFLVGLLCGAVGTLGDLNASIIKRQYKIKDYGTLFPGHGGVLDRFDSVIYVVPLMYFLLKCFTLFS